MAQEHDDFQLKVLQQLLERDWPDGLVAIDADVEDGVITVTLTDSKTAELAPRMTVETDAGSRDFAVRVEEGAPAHLFLFGQAHLPVPPSGPTTGGDPIWHGDDGWGTLALASPQVTIVDHAGQQKVVTNALLGCNHILGLVDQAQPGDAIGLYRTPGSATLDWFWPVTNPTVDPVDVALAGLSTTANIVMQEVRGLGPVTGVAPVVNRERLFKCGARTSITTAFDDMWGIVHVADYADRDVILRKTRPDFADVGDSGAAVLNRARQLVGIVVLGRHMPNGDHITYYLSTVPVGTAGAPPALFVQVDI